MEDDRRMGCNSPVTRLFIRNVGGIEECRKERREDPEHGRGKGGGRVGGSKGDQEEGAWYIPR